MKRTLFGLPLFAALLMAPLAAQMETHRHLDGDPARALYQRSAFAHGYIHGYEEGYQHGDTDVQMGRPNRQLNAGRGTPRVGGYRAHFGRREDFRNGYREGFRAGYGDSFQGRPFRAVAATRVLAQEMEAYTAEGVRQPSRTFDSGFAVGYHHGRQAGEEDATAGVPFRPVSDACAAQGARQVHSEDYCQGLRRGYALGYGDGYASQPLGLPPAASDVAVR